MVTVRESIGWLNDVPCSDEPIMVNGKMVYNHKAGKRWDIKYDKEKDEWVQTTFKTFKRRLRWDDLSFTLIAKWGYTHPEQPRAISIRESAILQTFPDDFLFNGSLSAMYRVIGNAVPPKMAKAIAENIKEMIK